MKYLKGTVLFFLCLFAVSGSYSQVSIRDSSVTMAMVNVVYGGYMPGGDLDDRFGYTSALGIEGGVKFRNNFYFTGGPQFVFGNTINEPVAQNILTVTQDLNGRNQFSIIGLDGRFTQVRMFERGWLGSIRAGKIIPVFEKANPNSGLYIEGGVQYFLHRVHFEVIGNNAPALDPENRKGYDRLTQGFGIVQSVGYRHFANNYLANFFIGLDFSQNFTKGQRDIQYDTGEPANESRLDLLSGFRVGWVFPIYRKAPDKFYIY